MNLYKKLLLDSISFNRTLNDKILDFKVQTSADKIAEIDVLIDCICTSLYHVN